VNFFGAGDVHGGGISVVGRLLMFTWSLGWTGFFEPISPPSISMARFEITSLAFMLDWVPEAGLPTAKREMIVKFAFDHFLGGADNRLADLRVEAARVMFTSAKRASRCQEARHHGLGLLFPADLEIAKGTLGLGSQVAGAIHFNGAKAIGFGAGLFHGLNILPSLFCHDYHG
jgi:hypothetical protein